MMKYLFIAASLFISVFVHAQHKVVADKIAGIVGDKIILQSDITNAIADLQRQGVQDIPADIECRIMEGQLISKALVMQAQRDSVEVSDDEVEAQLDNRIRYFVSQYGSKDALEEIVGRTVYQLKEDFRPGIREQLITKKMRDKIVESVKITPQEVKAYYDTIPKGRLNLYESELQIGEIVLYPKASRDLEKLAMDDLADYKKQVESGQAKFESLVQLYSDDPGKNQGGGQYNINRTEKQMDPAFINQAFRLKEGQISPVFKSKFGYHIIQMVSRAGDDAVVRHILLIPKVTDAEVNEAIGKLDTIRNYLVDGKMTFSSAVARYSEDENSKFTAGMIQSANGNFLTIDNLDKDIVAILKNLKVGEYSKPQAYTDERGKKAVRLIYLKSKTEPHRENLKDDYDKVAQRALEEKKTEALDKYFAEKIPTFYLMIDPKYANCEVMHTWLRYAARAN